MKTVFIVVRDYDCEGFRISGIYTTRTDADAALTKINELGHGDNRANRVVELPVDTYFDIGDIEL